MKRARYPLAVLILALTLVSFELGQQAEGGKSAPVTGSEETAHFLRSPFGSLPETEALLGNVSVKLQLLMGYESSNDTGRRWRAASLEGVVAFHGFTRSNPDGSVASIELAAMPYPEGGFEILVFGETVRDGARGPNPDVGAAFQLLSEFAHSLEVSVGSPGMKDLAYESYHLSYIQADRALALLKVLGYTTVEYGDEEAEIMSDKIYTPIQQGTGTLPIVVKIPDSAKTSLLDPPPLSKELVAALAEQRKSGISGFPGSSSSAVPDIGGTYLHGSTSGEPQQRLLLVYEKTDTGSLQNLLNLLRDQIDVPARQIVIEALVIELNSDRLKDLGISFKGVSNSVSGDFGQIDADTGLPGPFTFTFDSDQNAAGAFSMTLNALVDNGEAEILSKPSVLVLDGRQARIQIGQQVPVVKSTSTQAGIISSVDYFPVGIVLNLRPRVSEDGSEITMQAETIVSAVNQLESSETAAGVGVFLAPVVDNRQVQSFVRVSDNSPFIIGGLISTERRKEVSGIPYLSDIPALGVLFRRTVTRNFKREVIVVLTPHVVPLRDRTFSYVIPKDSGMFDSFGYQLFRNSYRLRGEDVFDLKFVHESSVYQNLVETVRARVKAQPELRHDENIAALYRGDVPGEEVLVRRMLWEIIDRTGYAANVRTDHIIFFEDSRDEGVSNDFEVHYISKDMATISPNDGLLLSFKAEAEGTEEHPFVRPTASLSTVPVASGSYARQLAGANRTDAQGNFVDWSILLSESGGGIRVTPLDLLKGVLTLKRVLGLNSSLPLTLADFHVGRQITFPSEEELQNRFHVVDRDTARLFYEVFAYYSVFESEFNRKTREVRRRLDIDP